MPVEFRDPPNRRPRRQLKWSPRCEKVMKRPGEWARIATLADAYQAVNAVRSLRSRKVRYPEGRFLFCQDGREVYAKYLGET